MKRNVGSASGEEERAPLGGGRTRRREDEARFKVLGEQVYAWRRCQQIRAYHDAVRAGH